MSASHILIGRQDYIPEALLDEFTGALRELSIPFEVEQREREVHAALEYLVPTAVVVFLAKPFFEAFLTKAGEDAYATLKRGFAALSARASSIDLRMVRSSPKKVADVSPYSRVLSVYSQTVSGRRLKFLLPAGTSEAEALTVFDSLLTLLREHHSNSGADALSGILSTSRTGVLQVLRYDAESGTWRLLELHHKQPPRP